MKNIFLKISAVILLTVVSAFLNLNGQTKNIKLQATGDNISQVTLKQSADIISTRLRIFGLTSFEVGVTSDKGQLKVSVPESTDMTKITDLLTVSGGLAFYETFTQSEIADLIKSDDFLFKLLGKDMLAKPNDPRVGCTDSENRKKVDEYLTSFKHLTNCRLVWGFESKKSGYCLFALKTNSNGTPLMVRSDIAEVKPGLTGGSQMPVTQIRLNASAAKVFAEATRANMGKAIAIVLDNKVYSWPVVQSVIESGELEVSGNLTDNDIKTFQALANGDPLPLELVIVK